MLDTIGYLAGDHLDAIYNTAQRYELYLLAALAIVALALIARHLLRRRRNTESDDPRPRRPS